MVPILARVVAALSLGGLLASALIGITTAPASATVAPTATLSCDHFIGTVAPRAVERHGFSAVLGRVALPTDKSLGAERQPDSTEPATRWWAKQGLVVKPERRVELIVPRSWRGRLAIGWGSPATPTERLVVDGCASGGPAWLAFAGGYWVEEPACAPLIVATATRRQRVHIGIGDACRGQDPPPSSR